MPITHAHSFLVHPGKHDEEQEHIAGTPVPHRGKLFDMLSGLFDGAQEECDTEIIFRGRDDGAQQNDCRDLLLDYGAHPNMENGRRIASRLQQVTTKRSGLGLLFVMQGTDPDGQRLVVARFPADQGIVAEEHDRGLAVQFIERVFMKNAKAYKSVVYQYRSLAAGFWEGAAIDRQINDARELSDYWIQAFLDSDLRSTPAAGTKRLALALKSAINLATNAQTREELIFASQTIRAQQGRVTSAQRLADALNFSPEATDLLQRSFVRPELFRETFRFDRGEYDQHVAFRSVRLDTGAVMLAENALFDDIFRRDVAPDQNGKTRFVTEGEVIAEVIRKTI